MKNLQHNGIVQLKDRLNVASRLAAGICQKIRLFGVEEVDFGLGAIQFLAYYAVEKVGGSDSYISLENTMSTEVLLKLPKILDPDYGLLKGAKKCFIARLGNRITMMTFLSAEPNAEGGTIYTLHEYPDYLVERIDAKIAAQDKNGQE